MCYINQLYIELMGTTHNNNVYQTLDGSAQIPDSQLSAAYPGVGGFINCSKPSGGEDASVARSFLSDLRPKQMAALTNTNYTNIVLVASVGGPDGNYKPMGHAGRESLALQFVQSHQQSRLV